MKFSWYMYFIGIYIINRFFLPWLSPFPNHNAHDDQNSKNYSTTHGRTNNNPTIISTCPFFPVTWRATTDHRTRRHCSYNGLKWTKMPSKYVPHYAIINQKIFSWQVVSDNLIHFLFSGNIMFPQMGELTQTYLWRFHFCTSGLVWDSCWWCCLGR